MRAKGHQRGQQALEVGLRERSGDVEVQSWRGRAVSQRGCAPDDHELDASIEQCG
jgi:hypothetical protein